MPKASSYLPWSKVAGSALLLGTPTYLWASAIGVYRLLPELRWQFALVASVLTPFVFILWADRSSESKHLRIGYLAVVALGIGATMLAAALPNRIIPAVLAFGMFTALVGSASLLWQRERLVSSWQRKALWAFVLAALPSMIAETHTAGPSLFFLSLLMVLGVTLCLTDDEGRAMKSHPARRLLSIAGIVFFLGWLVSTLAPGASSAASWGIRGILTAVRLALSELLKPIGILVEWLINLLLRLVKERQNQEQGFEMLPGQKPPEQLEEYVTPTAIKAAGWVVAVILVIVFIRVLWRLMERHGFRGREDNVTETRTSEWSASKTAKWAAAKARELTAPLAAFLAKRLGRRREAMDPLVSVYSDFLSLVSETGYPRKASETPLEFAHSLQDAIPECAPHIERISSLFSRSYYSGRGASPEELSSMRDSLKSLQDFLALDQKGRVP